MPAPVNVIPSVDFLLKTGGNPIGGGTGATLTLSRETNSGPHDRYAGWEAVSYAKRMWSLGFEAFYLEGAGGPPPKLTGADVAVTIGGVALKGLTEVTLALAHAVAEYTNSSTGLDRSVRVGARKAQLTIAADYYDPLAADNGAYKAIEDELMGVTSAGLAVVFSVGGISVSFTGLVSQGTVTKSVPEILKAGITLESSGAVLDATAGAEAGLAALLQAFFGAAGDGSGAAETVNVVMGSGSVDSSEYSGAGLLSDLSIKAPLLGDVTLSGTLQGNGALNRQATPAA